MTPTVIDSPSAWTEAGLCADPDWIFRLDARAQRDLIAAVRRVHDPARTLLDYGREDMDLGTAWSMIEAALRAVKQARGIALLRGLPRHDVTEAEFELMTWAIGLHAGVARPQGKASQYISQVRNAGTDYRSATGRGYSSDAELDFHTDGADLVALACYNQGASGGVSLVTSAVAAHNALIREHPGHAATLYQPLHFSRQGEQAPDEEPCYPNPVYAVADGRVYSKWNRNRVRSAQRLEGVPPLTEAQCAATDALDACLRRPDLMFTMVLEPGDLQLLDNHTMLHSRTAFVDADEPARRRLLYRLWLAPPDGARLPDSWRPFFRSIEPGTVRGGIRGHHHDARCQAFERRQAAAMGMDVAG